MKAGAEAQAIIDRLGLAAATTGDRTLVSCTVSPGLRFAGFVLAPPGFDSA